MQCHSQRETLDEWDQICFRTCAKMHPTKRGVNGRVLPIINEKAVPVYLVLQGEVKGEVFNAFIVVDLHLGGILICLEVFDDIREPHRQAIIPADKTPGTPGFWKTTVWKKKADFRQRHQEMNSFKTLLFLRVVQRIQEWKTWQETKTNSTFLSQFPWSHCWFPSHFCSCWDTSGVVLIHGVQLISWACNVCRAERSEQEEYNVAASYHYLSILWLFFDTYKKLTRMRVWTRLSPVASCFPSLGSWSISWGSDRSGGGVRRRRFISHHQGDGGRKWSIPVKQDLLHGLLPLF